MKITTGQKRSKRAAYTLIEMMFAISITSVMFFAGMSAITFSKIQLIKDKERAIISDFAVHYLEMLRGLPFDSMAPGNPINPIFDGVNTTESGKKIQVIIPPNSNLVDLNTESYQLFCPDLSTMSTRNPKMSLGFSTTSSGGVVRTRQATLSVSWESPLGQGGTNSMRLDLLRVRDIEVRQ
jgi:hypothetical protein